MASVASTISAEASRAVEAAERGARESVGLLERAAQSSIRLAEKMADQAPQIVAGIIVLLGAWILARIVKRLVSGVLARVSTDEHVDLILGRVAGGAVMTAGLLVALSTMGLKVGALVTSLGIVGVAVGIALREILANWLAGVLLLLQRPFTVGQSVEIGNVAGTVRDIRIRDTMIEATDGRIVYVPNLSVFTNNIVNGSIHAVRRVELPVSLPLHADVEGACDVAVRAARRVKCVVSTPEPSAAIIEVAPDGVRLAVRAWVDTDGCPFTKARGLVALAVTKALSEAGLL